MPGAADQLPGKRLGEAWPGFTVAGRLRRHRGKPLVVEELLEAIDGVIAGLVIGEDLGEEQAQGDPGGVEAFPPLMVAMAAGGLDEVTVHR